MATKAGDWKNYQRMLIPPVKDLHKLDVYEGQGGYATWKEVLTSSDWDPKKVTDTVKASSLRGRGGACFPTGLKWSFMPPVDPDKPRFLAVNGDESEPGTYKDRQLLEYNPHRVIEGILFACYAMSIKTAYLYIRGEYKDWIDHIQKSVDEAYDKGYVGKNILGTDFSTDIVVHSGAGAYICGEESSLMESVEGKRAYPRIKPPFPAQKGLWGMPTTINNVDTLACAQLVMQHGADAFAKTGAEKHPGPFLYGISGHVQKPGVYEYPTGMLMTDLIYEVCGGIRGGKKVKAVVPGGSSTPVLRADMLDGVTMDAESLREVGSMMGTGGMLVMDENTDMVSFLRRITHFYHHESCGQCTPCREGTGWLEKTVTRIDAGEGNLRDLDLLLSICSNMEGRTVCALADAAAWPVKFTIERFRSEFEAKCKPGHFALGQGSGDGANVTAVPTA